MSRYFDKSFFKFLLGFIVIIGVSLVIIFLVNNEQSGATHVPPVTNVAQP